MEPISNAVKPASLSSGILYNWEESLHTSKHRMTENLHVTCKNTKQEWTIGDSPNVIRSKFGLLITVGILKRVAFVFARTMMMFTGNFIDYAKLQAKHDWINSLDCEKEDAYARYQYRVYKAIPIEFLKESGKTLIMAVAIVPTILIGIFGLIFPYDGRKLMGDLEQVYAPSRFSPFASCTPCMADQEYRMRETLHHFNKKQEKASNYKQRTQKARILHSYGEYFKKKNISTDLPYSQLRDIINEAKGRGSDERSLRIFLHKHGEYRNPKDIKVLNLSFKGLTSLPKCLKHLENVQEIDLSNNQLRSSDLELLSELKNITHLRMGFNEITYVALKKFPKDCTLNLDNNPIDKIELANLKKEMEAEGYQGPKVRFSKPL